MAKDTNQDAGPDAPKTAGEKVREAVTENVVKPAQKAGETLRSTVQNAASGSASVSMKMIDQAEENTREAFNAMRAAAKAKDLSDVMKVQGDYLREQSSRSMAQAREISELIAQFGRNAIAPLGRGGKL
jgi:hypothetical protein